MCAFSERGNCLPLSLQICHRPSVSYVVLETTFRPWALGDSSNLLVCFTLWGRWGVLGNPAHYLWLSIFLPTRLGRNRSLSPMIFLLLLLGYLLQWSSCARRA